MPLTMISASAARQNRLNLLSRHPLLAGLAIDSVTRLAELASIQRISPGQCVFEIGSRPNGVYLIQQGRVSFTTLGVDGREHVIELFEAGHMFGDVGLIWGHAYGAKAVATEEVVLIKLPASRWMEVLRIDAELGIRIISELSGRVRRLCERIGCYGTASAQARLVAYLQQQAALNGDAAHFVLPTQKQVIASMLNMSSEALSRNLRTLADAGLLRVHGRRVFILDRARFASWPAEPVQARGDRAV